MKFDLTIPDPSAMRVGMESYSTLLAGTELHRIHRAVFTADQFNGTDRGNARFSPIRDAARTIIPTIYGAQSFECATCEIILRCPDVPLVSATSGPPPLQIVYPRDFAQHNHSAVRTTADFRLVESTATGQRTIGVNGNALLAGPMSTYDATRGWAERIHASCPTAQGLYYSSYQYGPEFAVVLFGDRIAAGAVIPISSRSVTEPVCHDQIRALAQRLSIDYQDV